MLAHSLSLVLEEPLHNLAAVVLKDGEFLSIKELLQFEDVQTRFAKISQTIDTLLSDNHNLTTKDINRVLYRQFGTRIHNGTISWNDQTISLSPEVQEQLRHNNCVAMGLSDKKITIAPLASAPKEQSHAHRPPSNYQPLRKVNTNADTSDANREYEVNNGSSMDLSVDDEQHQRMKWRR